MSIRPEVVVVLVAVGMAARAPGAGAVSNWLEPEEGVFAGYTGPEPYEMLLRQALIGDDHYRHCQLMRLPSFGRESVVYILDEGDSPTVVSRTMKEPLWGRIQRDVRRADGEPSSRARAAAQATAFETARSAVETKRAPIDRASADAVMDACREVLLGTRYAADPTRGNDGVTYHAGHFSSGTFLSGQAWSPKAGTIARDFVEMEEALDAYATAAPSKRDAAKALLLARAKALLGRVRGQSTPPPRPKDLPPPGG